MRLIDKKNKKSYLFSFATLTHKCADGWTNQLKLKLKRKDCNQPKMICKAIYYSIFDFVKDDEISEWRK